MENVCKNIFLEDDPIPFLTGTAVRYWLKSGAAKLHTTDSDTFIYTEDMKPSESFVRVCINF